LVFWIRRAVPEPVEWRSAKAQARSLEPRARDLFSREARRITSGVVAVCAISLTAHWAFMFWYVQHVRNLPELLSWAPEAKTRLASKVFFVVIGSSILGNFFAGWLAKLLGYRAAIVSMFLAYFFAMLGAYCVPRDHFALLWWLPLIGLCQGVFGLFTMYLPPLFPTLLRTTGAGFCYNIGRAVAAFGVVFLGLLSSSADSKVLHALADYRITLLYAGFLFLPAAAVSMFLPATRD